MDVIDVVLAGNPNSGKTTVFNALTGLRQKVGNYPGVTVEKKVGSISDGSGRNIRLHDLPGLYSLAPKSLDDKIATDILTGRSAHIRNLQLIIVIADASNLSRNLYLVTQTLELGIPVLLALNMMDVVESQRIDINIKKLVEELGIPVLPIIARSGHGIEALQKSIFETLANNNGRQNVVSLPVEEAVQQAAKPIGEWINNKFGLNHDASLAEAYRVISNDRSLQIWLTHANNSDSLIANLKKLVKNARVQLNEKNVTWRMLETNLRYSWVDAICRNSISQKRTPEHSFSEKLDQVLTHYFAGPLIFITLLALIFQTIFSWAEIPMDKIEQGIGLVSVQIAHYMPDGILQDLIVDGVIAGVGAVLVFLPQILFLFFFLSLLEDSGYMARAAFMLDKIMRFVGLSGRSVIPLLSSFACAIPGIMATRTIQSSRDRLITIMIAPLMSCSARLPVFALMIGAFIPDVPVLGFLTLPGITLLSMYLLGILAAIGAALVFKRIVGRNQQPSTFVMELPAYRLPSLRWTLLKMWERTKIFVTDAGKIIFAMSIVLWALAYFPRPENPELASGGPTINQSYAGKLGHAMEPVIKPLGFDWKMGIGLITSFAAREVMISTMATIYNVEGENETSVTLRQALRNDRDPLTGKPVYTPLVAISLMVFFVLACQCMSTVAIVKRETNSWRWPMVMIFYMTVLAYLGSLLVYQGGKLLGG